MGSSDALRAGARGAARARTRRTEAGPDGFLPDDPGALREFLAAYGLTLASGFTPLSSTATRRRGGATWRRRRSLRRRRREHRRARSLDRPRRLRRTPAADRARTGSASCARWTRHARWPVSTGSRSHSIRTTERWSRPRRNRPRPRRLDRAAVPGHGSRGPRRRETPWRSPSTLANGSRTCTSRTSTQRSPAR